MLKKLLFPMIVIIVTLLTLNYVQAETESDFQSAYQFVGGGVQSMDLYEDGEGVKWNMVGSSAKGFKIVWSKNSGPSYPIREGDKYHYYSDPYKRDDKLEAFDGAGTYYVRVCEYLGGGECGFYSNEISIELGSKEEVQEEAGVEKITLEKSGDSYVKWVTDGHSKKGFKIVWSKNPEPSYPISEGQKYHYYSDPSKTSDKLDAFDGYGTYYVRVCEYLGSSQCDVYSNEISLELGTKEAEEIEQVKQIELVLGEENMVKWIVDGYSKKGFKVVWGKQVGPTYPLRSGDKYLYYSDPNYYYTKLKPFAGDGEYYVRVCEYLGGKCGVYSNEVKIGLTGKEPVACTMEYAPVCGVDGKTYSNKCMLNAEGVAKKHYGECGSKDEAAKCTRGYEPVCGVNGKTYSNKCLLEAAKVKKAHYGKCEERKDEEIKKYEEKADKLKRGELDDILAELRELRSLVKEQQNQIRHLSKLLQGVSVITEDMQNSINNFITYGVDDNTKRLGEGERAAVMYSFKSAFGKLPENEDELADAIKIANGRWPSLFNEEAENKAKARFEEIYKRSADMNHPNDSAAIKVMAYGLRQKAENRNLNSEKAGIKIYKDIFGKVPESTDDWNAMQAITYSGATR